VTSLPDLESFLRRRLANPLPGAAAHERFAPAPRQADWAPDLVPSTARHAAALILLYPGLSGPAIPLTVRHRGLPRHPGQVSLPGGAVAPGESTAAAAVREAEEEIGIAPDHIRLIGPLSTLWVAVSNFVVHPVIAIADVAPEFRLHPHEVEELIEVPLLELQNPARRGRVRRQRSGVDVDYPFFELAGREVWGATAMILGEFVSLLDPAP